jgi:hypothetical protein
MHIPGAERLWPMGVAEHARLLPRHEAVGEHTRRMPHTLQRRESELHQGKKSAIFSGLRSIGWAHEHDSRPDGTQLLCSIHHNVTVARNEDKMRSTSCFREPPRCE